MKLSIEKHIQRKFCFPILIYGVALANAHNLLFYKKLSFDEHIENICKNINIFNMFIKTEFVVNLKTHKFQIGINLD